MATTNTKPLPQFGTIGASNGFFADADDRNYDGIWRAQLIAARFGLSLESAAVVASLALGRI